MSNTVREKRIVIYSKRKEYCQIQQEKRVLSNTVREKRRVLSNTVREKRRVLSNTVRENRIVKYI